MVQTVPAVRGHQQSREGPWRIVTFVVGASVGGVGMGLSAALIGRVLQVHVYAEAALVAVVSVAALTEWGLLKLPLPQIDKQVPRQWQVQFDPPAYAALWGLLLGAGAATRIPHATLYVVLVTAGALEPLAGGMLMLVYALSRSLAISMLSALATGRDVVALSLRMQRAAPFVHRLNAGYLTAIAVALVLSLVASLTVGS